MDDRQANLTARCGRQARERITAVLLEAGDQCRTLADRFGFEYFHFGLRAMLPPGLPVQMLVDGGPRGPHADYRSRRWLQEHPVLAKALHAAVPFDWREALQGTEASGKALLQRWSRLGMHHGVAAPLHARSAHGVLLLSGEAPLPKASHLRAELLRELHWSVAQMLEHLLPALDRAY